MFPPLSPASGSVSVSPKTCVDNRMCVYVWVCHRMPCNPSNNIVYYLQQYHIDKTCFVIFLLCVPKFPHLVPLMILLKHIQSHAICKRRLNWPFFSFFFPFLPEVKSHDRKCFSHAYICFVVSFILQTSFHFCLSSGLFGNL